MSISPITRIQHGLLFRDGTRYLCSEPLYLRIRSILENLEQNNPDQLIALEWAIENKKSANQVLQQGGLTDQNGKVPPYVKMIYKFMFPDS
jgi:hypothetical protein